jgi:sortase A
VLIALAGIALLLYPSAGNWLAARAHATATASYVEDVTALPDSERTALLDDARAYNSRIGVQTLTDPYTDVAEVEATSAEYERQLRPHGSDTMARIRIPAADIDLPVRHGTSESTLAQAVGHLQGSSLPVGGTDTNAVLTGHSGLPNSRLFTDLHDLVRGDLIYLDVLGETLAYRVAQIETVEPTDTDLLKVESGHDYLSLVTCTPIGVNSHRLIVRAERTTLSADESAEAAAPTPTVPFAWWAVTAAAAAIGGALVVLIPGRRHARSPIRTEVAN